MTAPASMFITYLWHYLVARVIYDEFLRPATHGHVIRVLLVLGVVAFSAVAVLHRRRTR